MLQTIKDATFKKLAGITLWLLSRPDVEKKLYEVFYQGLVRSIDDKDMKNLMWSALQHRPAIPELHWAVNPNSIEEERYRLATRETARYVTEKLPDVPNFGNPLHLLNFCMDRLEMEGAILEFGVFEGTTINHIASQTGQTVHGFDSFRGLPEQWGNAPAGAFDTQGEPPEAGANVAFHIGLFEETLPHFVAGYPGSVAFLHVDCDLYSSARTVLFGLKDKIVSGTMIVFDEYFNYPTWQQHEFKAFQEFIAESGKRYEYIGYTDRGFSAAVRML